MGLCVAVPYLLGARLSPVARSAERLQVGFVIRPEVFEWDNVVNVGRLAVDNSQAAAACEGVAD
jgi:hypothetical protein